MYEAFDNFLAADTWQASSDLELKRFYSALNDVVHDHAFEPEAMGKYIRQKAGAVQEFDGLNLDIDRLVDKARTIRDFLRMTEE